MLVDGRPVTKTGTLVLAAGERGQLSLPFGTFALVFKPGPAMNIQLTTNPMQIVFEGTDNPLGVVTNLSIPLQGASANLSIAVYSIGDGPQAGRIVHYTVS